MSFELPMEERELMRVHEEQKSRVRVVEERLNVSRRCYTFMIFETLKQLPVILSN